MYRTTSVKSLSFLAQESHGNGYISKISPKFQTLIFLQRIFGQFYFTDFGQNSD